LGKIRKSINVIVMTLGQRVGRQRFTNDIRAPNVNILLSFFDPPLQLPAMAQEPVFA
jgi:hypothetical protein